MVIVQLKKVNKTGESYFMRFFFVGFIDGVQRVCARMVAILDIETFVTFEFKPSYFKTDWLMAQM